jgi:creatinine amidohydrolase
MSQPTPGKQPAAVATTQPAVASPSAESGHQRPTCPPWRLEELTLADVREAGFQVAVLPMGATEPHNLHLPYGTDTIEASELASRCCQRAWEQGGRIVQLPCLPFGTETNLRTFPLALNLQPTTLFRVLGDLTESLESSGIHKLVIFNSHGGNDFKPFLREIYGKTPVHIFLCNWFQMIRDVTAQICEHPDDHAGEMETSVILHFRPELVRRTDSGGLTADAGSVRPLRFEALRNGWVGLTRPWNLLTTNSGSGNPHAATAAKGAQIAEVVAERIGSFLAELSQAPLDVGFPFE